MTSVPSGAYSYLLGVGGGVLKGLRHMKRPGVPDEARSPHDPGRRRDAANRAPSWVVGVVCLGLSVTLGPVRTVDAEATDGDIPVPTTIAAEPPATAEAKLQQAEDLLKAGEYAESARVTVSALSQAVSEANSDDPAARTRGTNTYKNARRFLLQLAKQAVEAEELGVAMSCYTRLHNQQPTAWEPLLGLADVSRLAKRPWDAYEYYRDYLKMKGRPQDHRGQLGFGLVCLDLGQPRVARRNLEEAIRLAPRNAQAHMGLARALQALRKAKEALAHAEQAAALDNEAPPEKRHPEYRYWLALILKDARQTDRAIAVARQLADSARGRIREDPADVNGIDRLDEALKLLQQLLEEQAETDQGRRNPSIYLDLVRVIEDRGAIDQIRTHLHALTVLEKGLEQQPGNVDMLLQKAQLYQLAGYRDEAVKAYQAVLKVSSGNDAAKKALRQLGAPLAPPEPTTATAGSTGTSARR